MGERRGFCECVAHRATPDVQPGVSGGVGSLRNIGGGGAGHIAERGWRKPKCSGRWSCVYLPVGQQSGRLEEMLERIAADYDRQVAVAADRLTALLEPVLVLLLVGLVGLIAAGDGVAIDGRRMWCNKAMNGKGRSGLRACGDRTDRINRGAGTDGDSHARHRDDQRAALPDPGKTKRRARGNRRSPTRSRHFTRPAEGIRRTRRAGDPGEWNRDQFRAAAQANAESIRGGIRINTTARVETANRMGWYASGPTGARAAGGGRGYL